MRKLSLLILLSLLCFSEVMATTPAELAPKHPLTMLEPWQIIPPTSDLPKPKRSGYAPINHVNIWYAEYGL